MIRFTKRFYAGMPLTMIGILTAFNFLSNYRTIAIVLFWSGMAVGWFGVYLMWRGIKPQKRKIEA